MQATIAKIAAAADKCQKIMLCDFGARANTAKDWLTALRTSPLCVDKEVMWLGIAGATKPLSHEEIVKIAGENAALGGIQVNASGMRDAAMSQVGEKRYFEELLEAWDDFKVRGGVSGLRLKLGKGMEHVGRAWKMICDGDMKPDEGLLFKI